MRRKPDESLNADLATAYATGEKVTYLGQPNGDYSIPAEVLSVTGKRVKIRFRYPWMDSEQDKLVDPRSLRGR